MTPSHSPVTAAAKSSHSDEPMAVLSLASADDAFAETAVAGEAAAAQNKAQARICDALLQVMRQADRQLVRLNKRCAVVRAGQAFGEAVGIEPTVAVYIVDIKFLND